MTVETNQPHPPPEGEKKTRKPSGASRIGQVRCLNCFERFRPAAKAERAACPACKVEWRISWPYPKTAKIRGPVWDKYPTAK
jgi:hypothetical protein